MDKLRLNERNITNTNIKHTESVIKRAKDTIERLRSQENSEFNRKHIDKIIVSLNENEDKLLALHKRYDDVGAGLLDDELNESVLKSNTIVKDKQLISDKKVKDKNQKKLEDKAYLDAEYKQRRNDGFSANYLQKETDKFYRDCSTIPDYIQQNLKDMPNNKGYIWRGVWCFGEKPKESDTTTLFEKCKGGILKIHEYTRTSYKMFEKQGKNQKTLVIDNYRKPILLDLELQKIKYISEQK